MLVQPQRQFIWNTAQFERKLPGILDVLVEHLALITIIPGIEKVAPARPDGNGF